MKKRNLVTALALTMALGLGATVYAASTDASTPIAPQQRLGLGRITGMRGYDYISSILKSKLGLSDTELDKALDSGKTMYEIATEKGMTQDQLKDALVEERTKAIDAAVDKGTITKEVGETIKESLENNMANCTGNFGQRQSQGRGQSYGRMGNGQGRANCIIPDSK